MSIPRDWRSKLMDRATLVEWRRSCRANGRAVVITNGCFDLLHAGHILTLRSARDCGDALIVAINSDASVKRIKGDHRPLVPEMERAEVLAAFAFVDAVTIFDEADPGALIDAVVPDALVKGGDWAADAIIGRETVEGAGGRVVRIPPVPGRSTTNIIRAILDADRS